MGSINLRYAPASGPRAAAVASTERSRTAADPSSKGWLSVVGGWIHSRPCSSSGSVRKNGEAYPRGCMAEPRSWTKPGSVSSQERVPPPTVSSASSTATERPARASCTAAASPFGPAPTTTASYAPRSVTRSDAERSYDPRWSSGSPASHQVAHTTPQTHHRVEHRPGTRVLPDVLCLRPLELRIHADLLQGHRLVHAEVRGERLEDVRPDPLLRRRADYAEADLVDRVVGARKRLDLGYRRAVFVLISAEGIPAGLRVAFGRHNREGLVVGVDHADTRIHRHASHGGADKQHLPGRDARHRRVEPAVRRLELGKRSFQTCTTSSGVTSAPVRRTR